MIDIQNSNSKLRNFIEEIILKGGLSDVYNLCQYIKCSRVVT